MKVNFNKLDRGYKKHKREYDFAIKNVMKSGWYILGKKVKQFEKDFANYIGSKYCVGLNSGLDALILAFRALGVGKNDEVIVPANTYIASILGITENGATPVLVEPDEFYNLDVDKIESCITNKTKAILVVHLYGQSANMIKIVEIAQKHNLFLVEDCAQSHGSTHNGKVTGTFGDVGCFSFYPTKNIGAFGDSGAIVTNKYKIFDKIRMLRNYGSEKKYYNEIQGINSRLDEIQAAILLVKLRNYNKQLIDRKIIVDYYNENIKNHNIYLPKIRKGSNSVYHLYVIRTKYRKELQEYLKENNIDTQIHYPIPPHLSKAYSNLNHGKGDFPITEMYAAEVLSLPLYEGMTVKEAKYVCKTLNNFKKDD